MTDAESSKYFIWRARTEQSVKESAVSLCVESFTADSVITAFSVLMVVNWMLESVEDAARRERRHAFAPDMEVNEEYFKTMVDPVSVVISGLFVMVKSETGVESRVTVEASATEMSGVPDARLIGVVYGAEGIPVIVIWFRRREPPFVMENKQPEYVLFVFGRIVKEESVRVSGRDTLKNAVLVH